MVAAKRPSILIEILPIDDILILVSLRVLAFSLTCEQVVPGIVDQLFFFDWGIVTIVSRSGEVICVDLLQHVSELALQNIGVELLRVVVV